MALGKVSAAKVLQIQKANTPALRTNPSICARDEFIEKVLLPIRDVMADYLKGHRMVSVSAKTLTEMPAFQGLDVHVLEGWRPAYDGTCKVTVLMDCPIVWAKQLPTEIFGRHVSGKYVETIVDDFCSGATGITVVNLTQSSEDFPGYDDRGRYDFLSLDNHHCNDAKLQSGHVLTKTEIHFGLTVPQMARLFAIKNNGRKNSLPQRVHALHLAGDVNILDMYSRCLANNFDLSPGKSAKSRHNREITTVGALREVYDLRAQAYPDVFDDTLFVLSQCVDYNGAVQREALHDRFIAAVGLYLYRHRADFTPSGLADLLQGISIFELLRFARHMASDSRRTLSAQIMRIFDLLREDPPDPVLLARLQAAFMASAGQEVQGLRDLRPFTPPPAPPPAACAPPAPQTLPVPKTPKKPKPKTPKKKKNIP